MYGVEIDGIKVPTGDIAWSGRFRHRSVGRWALAYICDPAVCFKTTPSLLTITLARLATPVSTYTDSVKNQVGLQVNLSNSATMPDQVKYTNLLKDKKVLVIGGSSGRANHILQD